MKRLSSTRRHLSPLGLWRIVIGSGRREPRATTDRPLLTTGPLVELLRRAQARGSAPAYVARLLAACNTRVAGGAE